MTVNPAKLKFAVKRADDWWSSTGETLDEKLQNGDTLVVERADVTYQWSWSGNPDLIADDDIFAATDSSSNPNVTYQVSGKQFKSLFTPPKITHVTPPSHYDTCADRILYLPGDVVEAFVDNPDPAHSFQWYIYDYFAGPDGVKEVLGEGKTLTLTSERVNGGNVWVRLFNANGDVISTYDAFNGGDTVLDVLEKVEAAVYVTPRRNSDGTESADFYHKVIFEKIEWMIGNDDLIPCDAKESVWIHKLSANTIYKQNFYDDRGEDSFTMTKSLWPGSDKGEDYDNTQISWYMSNSGSLNDPTLAQFQCVSANISRDFIYVDSIDEFPPQMAFSKNPTP